MSDHDHDPLLPLPPEPDNLPFRLIALVVVGSLIVFGLGVAWSSWIIRARAGSLNPGSATQRLPALGVEEVGIVDQRLFEQEHRAQTLAEEQRRRLDSYGWVDRERGVVHIPIDRAIELMERGR